MTKKYTKTFNFGKVAYNNGKNKKNLVCLDVSLEIKDGKTLFSASGEVWKSNMKDIEMGWQCIDDIYDQFKGQIENRKLYESIMGLWERNHLNDMHPDCVHQRKTGLSKKELSITKLQLSYKLAGSKQGDIKDRVIEDIEKTGKASITENEKIILNLPYWLTVPTEQVSEYPLYEVKETEIKKAGWVTQDEHPEGQLSKPCTECSYKYGSSSVYEPIEKGDLAEIMNILSIPLHERNTIIKLGK